MPYLFQKRGIRVIYKGSIFVQKSIAVNPQRICKCHRYIVLNGVSVILIQNQCRGHNANLFCQFPCGETLECPVILQILARCGAFFIGFVVKGQMNHDFAFRIEVNPCVIEITIGNALGDNYLNTHQIQATFFGLRVCDESIAFLEEWLALCEEPNFLNPGCVPAGSRCIAHREDQSALSLLCKKFGIEPHKDPTQYGRLPEKYFAPGRLWEEPSHPDDVYAPFIVLHRSPEMNIKDVVRQYACAILPRSISIHLIDSNHIPPSN